MLTKLRKKLSVIDTGAWHYRLIKRYFKAPPAKVRRFPAYWGFVLVVIVVTIIETVLDAAFVVAAYVLYYPWITFVWLLGFKPHNWFYLPNDFFFGKGDQKLCLTKLEVLQGTNRRIAHPEYWYWEKKMPVYWVAPAMGLFFGIVYGLPLGNDVVSTVFQQGGYWIPLEIYGLNLAGILIGQVWHYFAGPGLGFVYKGVFPEITYVDSSKQLTASTGSNQLGS